MSTAERNYYGGSFLSDDFRAAIQRRLRELGGLALVAAAGAAAAALATWSVNDPSLSHATSAPVRNLLGAPGAIAADLAMQLFGLATIAIILPPAFWGWRLLTHRAARPSALARRWPGSPASRWRRGLRRACRAPPIGRCRPASAASSVTRCCASSPASRAGPFMERANPSRKRRSARSPSWRSCSRRALASTGPTADETRRQQGRRRRAATAARCRSAGWCMAS